MFKSDWSWNCLASQAGDTWAGEGGDAKKGADVISYLKGLHEGADFNFLCSFLESRSDSFGAICIYHIWKY